MKTKRERLSEAYDLIQQINIPASRKTMLKLLQVQDLMQSVYNELEEEENGHGADGNMDRNGSEEAD